jgi:hypothetical protein
MTVLLACPAVSLKAQPVYINEFLASNVTTNPDIVDFDDYSDWIQLNGDGEQLGLAQISGQDTLFIDQLTFPEQNPDISYGRNPDGGLSLQHFDIPTPQKANSNPDAFKRGILLVNGVSFKTYGQEIIQAYSNRAFWGTFPITFWDSFETPVGGYPAVLPEPLGHGAVPPDTLSQFSTVIWVGNNYQGSRCLEALRPDVLPEIRWQSRASDQTWPHLPRV